MSAPHDSTRVRLERTLRTQAALLELTRHPIFLGENREAAFDEITRSCAETLEVERAVLWAISEDRSSLQCMSQYVRSGSTPLRGDFRRASSSPTCFETLVRSEAVERLEAVGFSHVAGFLKRGPAGA